MNVVLVKVYTEDCNCINLIYDHIPSTERITEDAHKKENLHDLEWYYKNTSYEIEHINVRTK